MIESPRPIADGRPTAVFVFNGLRMNAGRLTESWLERLRAFDSGGWATHAALINRDAELERSVDKLREKGKLRAGTVVHHYAARDRRIRALWRAPLGPGESIDPRVGDWLDWLSGRIPGAVVFADSPAAYPYLAHMSNPTVARVAVVHLIHSRGAAPTREGRPDPALTTAGIQQDGKPHPRPVDRPDPPTARLMPKFEQRFAPVIQHFDSVVTMTEHQAADLRERFGSDVPIRKIRPAVAKPASPRPSGDGAGSGAGRGVGHGAGNAAAGPSPRRIVALGALENTFQHSRALAACVPVLRADPELRLEFVGSGDGQTALETLAKELGVAQQVSFPQDGRGSPAGERGSLAGAALAIWTGSRDAFPLGIARAIAHAVPVVALDQPYGPAELLSDPDLGDLIPMDDPDRIEPEMTTAIRARLASRQQLSQAPAGLSSIVVTAAARITDRQRWSYQWLDLAADLAAQVWDERRPGILLEGLDRGARLMRTQAVLANATTDMSA